MHFHKPRKERGKRKKEGGKKRGEDAWSGSTPVALGKVSTLRSSDGDQQERGKGGEGGGGEKGGGKKEGRGGSLLCHGPPRRAGR